MTFPTRQREDYAGHRYTESGGPEVLNAHYTLFPSLGVEKF